MRMTNSMMANTLAYWTAKQLEKVNELSTTVTSGQRINKPSDDPGGASQVLADRTTISKYARYESNISQAQTWAEESDTTLDAVNTLLTSAKSILSSLSSSSDDLSTSLAELNNIYDEIISYANTSLTEGYMYSGNDFTVKPFFDETSVSGGTASNIVFDLSGAASSVTIEITDSTGAVVRTITTTGAEGTNTISWNGQDDSGNILADGDYSFTVTATDSSGNAVSEYPSYRGGSGSKTVITGEDSRVTLNNDGGTIFSDVLKVISEAITAVNSSDTSSTTISTLTACLADAVSQIRSEETSLANAGILLDNSANRYDELMTYINGKISDTETGDTTLASEELTVQKNAYETTISATASILNMNTLKDYL
ncbi:MAG: FlgD immunoglobulin-like domain containing protein [Smithella sp.]